MRVEVREIAEGLNEEHQPRTGAGCRLGVRSDQQTGSDAAKLAQPCPMPAEDGAQQPRHGEYVLPMRHGLEDVLFDPLAVQEHPLLVTARAEIARLAGVGEQIVVPAGVAVDARKSAMRVAALDEKSLEVIRIYRGLIDEDATQAESGFAFYLEEASLVTLGICYEKNGKFAGGAYNPIVRRLEKFSDEPLSKVLKEHEKHAEMLMELDARVGEVVKKLKERGFVSPYLRAFVVARINPLR